MLIGRSLAIAMMFFLQGAETKENPWQDKVAPAVERARETGTADALREAMQIAWRADDWQVGLKLAHEALDKHANAPQVYGPAARALWRAGYLAEAERVATRLSPQASDPISLEMLITVNLAKGNREPALAAAENLAKLDGLTAEDLYYIVGARSAANCFGGVGKLIRRIEELIDPDNGYPEMYLQEQLAGAAEFSDAAGDEPLNQIVACGSVEMPPAPLVNLPSCEAYINGHGPYRLIIDTGGSIVLSLDDEVAAEVGLKSIAAATIHGVSGKSESGQAIVKELRIGGTTCRRVITRIFPVREAILHTADGILGTGVFSEGRMTLDFANGRLVIEESSERPGPGTETELRIVADGKLLVPTALKEEPAVALLDSGADAFAVSPSRLKRMFPGRRVRSLPSLAFGIGSGDNPSIALAPGADFVLAGREYKNFGGLGLDVLDTLLAPMLGVQTDLLIGMPVMRQMKTLTVDCRRCRMWVDWLNED